MSENGAMMSSTTPAGSNILLEYLTQAEKILMASHIDDYMGMRSVLTALKQILLALIKTLLDQYSPEQMQVLVAGPWPPNLALLKLALTDGLSIKEQPFLNSIASLYAEGFGSPDFAKSFLLARLLLPPFNVAQETDWGKIPAPYLKNFIHYQFETSPLMQPGDGKRFYQHMEKTLRSLLNFMQDSASPLEHRTMAFDIFYACFTPPNIMMADENALPIMKLRYEILHHAIQNQLESQIEWQQAPRNPEKKIRLGICSATLFTGGETIAMLASLGALDRNKYEIILFYFDLDMKFYTDMSYLRELFERIDDIVAVPMGDFRKSVNLFRKKNLDILWHQSHIGLTQTAHAVTLTFIHRLARCQCAALVMHPLTTGNPHFQYFINIENAPSGKGWAEEFSETEINVPGVPIYITDNWHDEPNRIVTRESLSIPEDAVIYFSGGTAGKYNAEMVMTWIAIIKEVPNSYLVLYPFNPTWYPRTDTILAYYARLQQACLAAGVDLNRIKVVGHVNGEAITNMIQWGHIYLGTFPYGGLTTLSDSLRGSLCPVCLRGKYSRANADACMLAAYGLTDLIATSTEDYIKIGVRLGIDSLYRESTKLRVQGAWKTRRPHFREHIAKTHAAAIDEIVARENNFIEETGANLRNLSA